MDHSFIRVARLDFGKKMCGIGAAHNGRLNKGRIESFKVERAMDVQAPRPLVVVTARLQPALTQPYAGFV